MTSAATTASLQEADIYIDYKSFLADNFDANAYANATINGSLDGSSGGDGSDVATALAKLSFSVDSLNKQIQDQVASHYEGLLQQVSGIRELENVLAAVKKNIEGLNVSLERLRQKITTPYDQIQASTIQLERLQTASELLRRLIRFLYLARRLEMQLPPSLQEVTFSAGGTLAKVGGSDGRDLAKAALTLNELDSILAESDLQGIDVVESEIPIIQQTRERILAEADRVLDNGMKTENQADIASALQVFYNLRQMVPKVHTIVDTILGELLRQIKHVVDMQSLNKQVKESGGSHSTTNIRRLNDPTSTNVALWTQALWGRMEKLMDFMGDCCIKLYVLERVLERKRDPLTHVAFIEEVVKTMDDGNNLVRQFWKVLSANFEKELRDATKVSSFLQTTFMGGYPKLLRLLHEFFSRVSTSSGTTLREYNQSPEYVLMLRSINAFETAFLSRSLTRMYDPINAAFPSSGPLSRNPPGRNDVTNVVRTISSELDTAKFDTGLLRAVAKNVVKALSIYCMKCEGLIATDPSAYQVVGPGPMSNSQNMNFELINNLYALYQSVWKVLEEFPDFVVEIVRDGIEATHRLMLSIGEPLVDHIIAELEAVVLKIHREDFSRQTSRNYINTQQDGSSSVYMTELSIRLRYIQTELLTRLSCGEQTKTWTKQIAQRLLFVFIFQASLVRPLSEGGKLKLTADMTQLEFSVSQLVGEHGMKLQDLGEDYHALRAFKPLLFLDVTQLAAAHHTTHLPTLVLLHHLIVRSTSPLTTLPLPHKVYNTTEAEYMRWVDEHTGAQVVEFVLTAITKGSKVSEEDREKVLEYRLMKEVVKERFPEMVKE